MTTRRNFLRKAVLGVALFVTLVAGYSLADNPESVKLKAGIAREIITPKLGGLLAGYGSDKPSTEVHDDLTVTALTLEYGQTKTVLLSATVCLIDDDLCAKIRKQCGDAAGVPASNVIIAATHTHSGPLTSGGGDAGKEEARNEVADYCNEILIPQCVAAVKASAAEMKPVTVGVAKTESKVGINRRQILPNGRVILGQNPWGAYDPEMTVISFKGEDGKPIANIVHCTAHCTAIGNTTVISRDWAGVVIDRLEKESGAVTMFFNGMQGDVAPRMANGGSTGDMKHALEVGAVAALDAVRAYKDIRVFREETLSLTTGEIRLPDAPIMPLEDAEKELAKIEAAPPGRWGTGNKSLLTKVVELHAKGETGESYFTYDQTLVRIGPVVLVPVPFEASSEISLRLRAYSKYGHTLALGCTNGSNSYLPSQDQICRGGYEVERWTWARPRRLADNADMYLINQNVQLMEKFN